MTAVTFLNDKSTAIKVQGDGFDCKDCCKFSYHEVSAMRIYNCCDQQRGASLQLQTKDNQSTNRPTDLPKDGHEGS